MSFQQHGVSGRRGGAVTGELLAAWSSRGVGSGRLKFDNL